MAGFLEGLAGMFQGGEQSLGSVIANIMERKKREQEAEQFRQEIKQRDTSSQRQFDVGMAGIGVDRSRMRQQGEQFGQELGFRKALESAKMLPTGGYVPLDDLIKDPTNALRTLTSMRNLSTPQAPAHSENGVAFFGKEPSFSTNVNISPGHQRFDLDEAVRAQATHNALIDKEVNAATDDYLFKYKNNFGKEPDAEAINKVRAMKRAEILRRPDRAQTQNALDNFFRNLPGGNIKPPQPGELGPAQQELVDKNKPTSVVKPGTTAVPTSPSSPGDARLRARARARARLRGQQ